MRNKLIFTFLWCTAVCANADVVVQKYLESPEMLGQGEFRAMMWKIYEAELYAEETEFSMNDPFALKLTYARRISGGDITDRSIELIRRQGIEDELKLAAWHKVLDDIFPDVEKGTEIVGTHLSGQGAYFYVDGERTGHITDQELCSYFFGIWLSEDTVAPDLRSDLLGLASN